MSDIEEMRTMFHDLLEESDDAVYVIEENYDCLIIVDISTTNLIIRNDASDTSSVVRFHMIDVETHQIISYEQRLQSINTIIGNYCQYNDLNISKCCGNKCREFGPTTLCESCSDPDYIMYEELFYLIENAKVVDRNMLLIYELADYNALSEITSNWTKGYVGGGIRGGFEITITDKERSTLIDNMYSAFRTGPLRESELLGGPDPLLLPIPTSLLN